MPATPAMDYSTGAFWCTLYGAGIIGTLAVYGVLQERIMQYPYGGDLFVCSTFLVFCNRVVNCGYASTMMAINGEELSNKAPIWKYLVISLSNVAATSCQYECLKYVSFPVQMLGKSFKMMPVMLWGIAIGGKAYGVLDWAIAGCVTFGVTEFLMTGSISSPNDDSNSMYGLMLLVLFLACDGLTSTMQEKLFAEHKTSKFNQMLYVNGCSAITSILVLLGSGNFTSSFSFLFAHAEFARDAMILSTSAAASQYFIYAQILNFGALVFAATMNVRQVASIIISCVRYGHVITWLQVMGLFVVFGALFFKSYLALTKQRNGEEKPLVSNDEYKKNTAVPLEEKV
jgi:adenosine 3'-phospho 5'-phosphosulfate transporter B2